MAKQNETTLLVLALLITATLLCIGFWWFRGLFSSLVQLPLAVSDRSGAPIMVKVQPSSQAERYEFASIKF
jgi:hypothetical protein